MVETVKKDGSVMSAEIKVSLTEAKRRFGELWKQAAYGGNRVIITVRGKPAAVLASFDEIQRGGFRVIDLETAKRQLKEMDELREQIKTESGVLSDSAELIRELRETREG
jgi:prevent-host-death family protein